MTTEKKLHTFQEKNNSIYTLDLDLSSKKFVTGGKDSGIRIYDELRKDLILELKKGDGYGKSCNVGHSNRIFCVKFHPGDTNLIFSGGWDKTVLVWDIRTGNVERKFNEANVCGEAIDIQGNFVVTGSYGAKQTFSIWDLRSCEFSQQCYVNREYGLKDSQLYATSFCHNDLQLNDQPRFLATGGCGENDSKVYYFSDDSSKIESIGEPIKLDLGVYTLDFSPSNYKIAFAGGSGKVKVMEVVSSE